MMKMNKLLLICFFMFLGFYSYSQRCEEYYSSKSCRPGPHEVKDMILSSQSRGVELEARKTYTFRMTLFGSMDYRIVFCSHKRYLPVHYVIKEVETGNVLYDNKDDTYVESIGFTMENTTIVNVDVTLLAEETEFDDLRQNRACFGLPIYYRKVKKLGF